MAYESQYYPGATSVGANRRKHMSGKLEKLREISDEDLTAVLGHRAPGATTRAPTHHCRNGSLHALSAKQWHQPGAAAGDRVRYASVR